MTWTAPQRIPGSDELRIVHTSGAVVLRTASVPPRYLAWRAREAGLVDERYQRMAVLVGGFDRKQDAIAAIENQQ